MGILLVIFIMLFVVAPIAKAYAERLGRGPALPPPVQTEEVALLREEVERLGAEVTRLREENSFVVRLLTEGTRSRGEEPKER